MGCGGREGPNPVSGGEAGMKDKIKSALWAVFERIQAEVWTPTSTGPRRAEEIIDEIAEQIILELSKGPNERS